jgi:methylated-DNA-[protein]-cysteine S-methyltransferase
MGKLLIKANETHITDCIFWDRPAPPGMYENDVIRRCLRELNGYFAGRLKNFTVPLAPLGTAFRMRVWNALREIPYGETRTYKQLAEAVGNPKAGRAVGGANHHNPIVILVPCHRVIGSDGKLTGFGGGTDVKKFLLEHEARAKK